jgi:aminopeptidase C
MGHKKENLGRMPRVQWDEENLLENENSRCATMTIDEPPTPFNFEYCEDEEEDENDEGPISFYRVMIHSVGLNFLARAKCTDSFRFKLRVQKFVLEFGE